MLYQQVAALHSVGHSFVEARAAAEAPRVGGCRQFPRSAARLPAPRYNENESPPSQRFRTADMASRALRLARIASSMAASTAGAQTCRWALAAAIPRLLRAGGGAAEATGGSGRAGWRMARGFAADATEAPAAAATEAAPAAVAVVPRTSVPEDQGRRARAQTNPTQPPACRVPLPARGTGDTAPAMVSAALPQPSIHFSQKK